MQGSVCGIKAFEVKRGGAAAGGRFHGKKKVLGPRHDGRGEEAPQSCLRTRTSFPCPCYGKSPTSSPTRPCPTLWASTACVGCRAGGCRACDNRHDRGPSDHLSVQIFSALMLSSCPHTDRLGLRHLHRLSLRRTEPSTQQEQQLPALPSSGNRFSNAK